MTQATGSDPRKVFTGAKVDPVEVRITLPDGAERIIETRGEATLDAGGRPLIVNGTLQDVTEQKVTQTALRLIQTRYRIPSDSHGSAIGKRISPPARAGGRKSFSTCSKRTPPLTRRASRTS